MVVNQQFTYEDDLNEYNVGDVIRFWNDDIKKATYKMIAHVDRYGFLLVFINNNSGCTDSFYENIPDMIKTLAKNYQHVKKVNFMGTDLGNVNRGY